jgi:hypothetical protein
VTLSRRDATPAWTGADQLLATLRRRWDTGTYLESYASGEPWQPVSLPVKGPGAGDLLERLDASRSWLARFERETRHFWLSCCFRGSIQAPHTRLTQQAKGGR